MMRFLKNNIFLILLIFLPVCCIFSHALATENVLVFDDSNNVISSYDVGGFTISAQPLSGSIEAISQLFPNGFTEFPQFVRVNVTLPAGAVAFVPNMLNGSFPVNPGGLPDVSLYSFDAAMTDHTGTQPGLSFSPSQGIYNETITVRVQASDGAHLEYARDGQWVTPAPDTSVLNLDVYKTTTLSFRAINNSGSSAPVDAQFTIERDPQTNPEMVDSDGDGIPDSWEVAHGTNPLQADLNHDSDEDGYSDLDELLRSSDPRNSADTPPDFDGDGWSDFDEGIRITSINNPNDFPTARRLYEVEYNLHAEFHRADNSPIPVRFTIYEIFGNPLLTFPTNPDEQMDSVDDLRLPAGSASVLRASGGADKKFILKHYLPIIKDVNLSDLAEWCSRPDTPDYNWNSAAEWQLLITQMLTDLLAPQPISAVISPASTAPLYMLERQLGIVAGNSATVHFFIGESVHAPAPSVVGDLQQLLVSRNVDFNNNFENIESLLLLDAGCHNTVSRIAEIYASYTANDENLEYPAADIMAEQSSRYLTALALYYDLSSLDTLRQSHGLTWCQLFSAAGDIDGDQLSNMDEIFNRWDISSTDTDADGIADNNDNCPAVKNPQQSDFDNDGLGDACDKDDDNDGLDDLIELAFGSNPFEPDTDHDGVSDFNEWEANSDPGILVTFIPQLVIANTQSVILTGSRLNDANVILSSDIGTDTIGAMSYPTETTWVCAVLNLAAQYGIHEIEAHSSKDSRHGYAKGIIDVLLFPGDLDGDLDITLTDAIIGLQLVTGHADLPLSLIYGDSNDDTVIGLPEVIFILRNLAGLP